MTMLITVKIAEGGVLIKDIPVILMFGIAKIEKKVIYSVFFSVKRSRLCRVGSYVGP